MDHTEENGNASEGGHDVTHSVPATSHSSDSEDSDCSTTTILGKYAFILYKKYYGDPDEFLRRRKFQQDIECDTSAQNDASLSPSAENSGEIALIREEDNCREISGPCVEEDAVATSSHRDVQAQCSEEAEGHDSYGLHVSETCHDKTQRYACL